MSHFGVKCAGHEGAGVIVQVGDQVKNLKVGQRAGFKPIQDVCHSCEYCRTGRETYCTKAVLTGIHCDGTHHNFWSRQDQIVDMAHGRNLQAICCLAGELYNGPVMCSASTIYTSLKESELKPGQWAVFPGGGGGVGIQGVQLAAAMGLRPIVVDTGDERRKLALSLGAEEFVDFKEGDPVKKVQELTGGGAHGVFVTGMRAGAKVMCIGIPPAGKYHLDLDPTALVFRGQQLRGTLVSSMADVDETLDFARRGKLHLEPTVVGLSKFNEAVQKLKNGQVAGRMVVDFNIP
ncbi:hypothetical protein LTS15_001416 [Exophiala xenobiotica]|nr:hypothetical protein LTS15_001416 [Exophiala xenobiotica]